MKFTRLPNNPVITPALLPGDQGANINGPSLIAAPDWLAGAPGRYLLYFGHHNGHFIRLAYADRVEGPYTLYGPGALQLGQTVFPSHIASPDVHVDHERREVLMYYHGCSLPNGQRTMLARSADGLHFTSDRRDLGGPYMRIFDYRQQRYGLCMPGIFNRQQPDGGFEEGPQAYAVPDGLEMMRHTAVRVVGDVLEVLYTCRGDSPERVYLSQVDLTANWRDWRIPHGSEVLRPDATWEGTDLPLSVSLGGQSKGRENALRDPCLFCDRTADGEEAWYLLYAVAGESGIAVARVEA